MSAAAAAREICSAAAIGTAPFRLGIGSIPKIQACGGNVAAADLPAAGLSGLSLPDAHCEHTNIRPCAKNLTRLVVSS